jgi:hypothetical protein
MYYVLGKRAGINNIVFAINCHRIQTIKVGLLK